MRPALLAGALLLAGCGHGRLRLAPGEEGEVIEAEGWAPIDAGDLLGTKKRSLADAQKKAVEKAAGVFISAKTRVEQTIDVDERILAKAEGYVRKYDVLGERQEGGFLKTRIRALVLYNKIGQDMKDLGLSKPPPAPGNPRVAVEIRGGDSAASGLRAALLAKGFKVVESCDGGACDLILRGEATVKAVEDARLGSLHSERARLTLKVLKPQANEILAEKSQEASGLDVSEDAAAGIALEKAGAQAGEALSKDLASLLRTQVGVAVKVRGLADFQQASRLVDDIRMNPEVAAAYLMDYRDGAADVEVTTQGVPGDELSSLMLRSRKFHLSALSVSAYAVELESK